MKTNFKSQPWLKYGFLSVLAVAVLGASYYISSFLLIAKNNVHLEKIINEQPLVAKALAFTNEKGQKWYMSNPGKNVIDIGGNIKEGPKIVKAEIDPLKVAVGQKQTMTLEVNSNTPLNKVVAEITTDHKTITVELKQTNERDLTFDDIKNSPFLVKENGEVVFSANKSPLSNFVHNNLVNKFFETAKASNVRHYTYSGDWIVHDTGETTYRTKFIAYDGNNKSNSTTLSWSDPCSMPLSKNVTWANGGIQTNTFGFFRNSLSEFVLTNTIQSAVCDSSSLLGVENINYIIPQGTDIAISSDKLILMPGNTITLEDLAYLNLPGSATTKIAKGYVWIKDNDSDGFFTSAPEKEFTTSNSAPVDGGGEGGQETGFIKQGFLVAVNYLKRLNVVNAQQPTATWVKTSTITDQNNYLADSPIVDCDDNLTAVNPGQTAAFTTAISGGPKNGTFDYNCDNTDSVAGWLPANNQSTYPTPIQKVCSTVGETTTIINSGTYTSANCGFFYNSNNVYKSVVNVWDANCTGGTKVYTQSEATVGQCYNACDCRFGYCTRIGATGYCNNANVLSPVIKYLGSGQWQCGSSGCDNNYVACTPTSGAAPYQCQGTPADSCSANTVWGGTSNNPMIACN